MNKKELTQPKRAERKSMDQMTFRGHRQIDSQITDRYASLQKRLAILEYAKSKMMEYDYKKVRADILKAENILTTMRMIANKGFFIHDN